MRACFFAAPAVSSVDAWLDEFLPSRVQSSTRETALLEGVQAAALLEMSAALRGGRRKSGHWTECSDGVRMDQTRPQRFP